MPISHNLDESRLRLTLTLSGTVSSARFNDYIYRLYESRPELFEYDCVTDLRDYEGDLSDADVAPLMTLYAAHVRSRQTPSHSYLVTTDPGFGWWAAALDEQFPDRLHHVVNSLDEAHARLDARQS